MCSYSSCKRHKVVCKSMWLSGDTCLYKDPGEEPSIKAALVQGCGPAGKTQAEWMMNNKMLHSEAMTPVFVLVGK